MKKERNSKLGYAKNGWLYKEKTAGYIFSAPFIFGFLFFVIVPVATSLYYAFCNYNILKPARWVGLKNFIDIFQDPTFYKALGVTLKFAFISVPLKLVFALIVALILLKGTKLTPFYRAAYYLPSILGSSVAVAILWKALSTGSSASSSHGWAVPQPPCGSSFCWQSGSSVRPCSFFCPL